jgi:hypothetical protein
MEDTIFSDLFPCLQCTKCILRVLELTEEFKLDSLLLSSITTEHLKDRLSEDTCCTNRHNARFGSRGFRLKAYLQYLHRRWYSAIGL